MEQLKRIKRTKLLKAFDTYKTNVSYGIVDESYEQHTYIKNWYKDLLDLKNSAFIKANIPTTILYYINDYELPKECSYVLFINGEEQLVSEEMFNAYLQGVDV